MMTTQSKWRIFILLVAFAYGLTMNMNQGVAQVVISYGAQLEGEDLEASYSGQMVLIEFWATWCGPCIAAFSHTENLQEAFKDDLKVVAITKEPAETVARFLNKRPLKGILLSDIQGVNHVRYNVTHIPLAVLLSPSGEMLWTGHPADLHEEDLRSYIEASHASGAVRGLTFKKRESDNIDQEALSDWQEVPIVTNQSQANMVYREFPERLPFSLEQVDDHYEFTGTLQELMGLIFHKQSAYIHLPPGANLNLEVRFPMEPSGNLETIIHESICHYFLQKNRLELDIRKEPVTTYHLTVNDIQKFWGKDRIQLTTGAESIYLIDEESIEADNMTLHSFCLLLSEVLNKPVVLSDNFEGEYDWKLQIKNFPLMKEQLLQQYGIHVEVNDALEEVVYFHERKG